MKSPFDTYRNKRLKDASNIVNRANQGKPVEKAILQSAIKVLGKSGDPRIIRPLLKVLTEGNMEYHADAALALGELGDKAAIESLINALCNGYDELRGNAAKALARLGETHWQTYIKGSATDFSELRESGQSWAFEFLYRACNEGDKQCKIDALRTLYDSLNPNAIEPVIKASSDEDSDVRCQAVKTFATILDPRVVVALVKNLNDKEYVVRKLAANSLVNIAKNDFSQVTKLWGEIKKAIETPHDDRRYGGVSESSAKCLTHYDTMKHVDTGIGLDIPPELII